MDISKIPLVAVMMVIVLVSTAAVAQENAVGGQVRLRGSDKPLGQVEIKVAQMPEVRYTTDDKDGVYVLLIPKSLKSFDLIYEHDSCFRMADEGIRNEQAQNKRPVRKLRPFSPSAVRSLTPAELNEIIDRSREMKMNALANNTPALLEAGQANLYALSAAAQTIGNEAQSEVEKGQLGKAEESYKLSIAIFNKVRPATYQLAVMHDRYAALLRKTGRAELADQQAARANEVRLQAKSYENVNPLMLQGEGIQRSIHTYHAWLDPFDQIEEWSRSDKFALKHIDSLPNLVGTMTVISGVTGLFGRVSLPGK